MQTVKCPKCKKISGTLPPVSYTHLDVYKRQVLHCGSAPAISLLYHFTVVSLFAFTLYTNLGYCPVALFRLEQR